jgi:hypothetical protein
MVIPIFLGLVLTGGAFIVVAIAAPQASIAHFEQTGIYLIPAKGSPIETTSRSGMWAGMLAVLLLGGIMAGAGIYGLAAIQGMAG